MGKSIISLLLLAAAWIHATATADEIALAENAPDRHVVVKGDTLWGISERFLRDPWRWPDVWGLNKDEIKNPHWIYPGDVIYLDFTGASPRLRLAGEGGESGDWRLVTTKLSPEMRKLELADDPAAKVFDSLVYLGPKQPMDPPTTLAQLPFFSTNPA